MVVATAGPEGLPSARVVLLRGFDARGFAFFTSFESRKGREVAANPRAAVLLASAARARAALDGRDYVVPDDVKALATAVLRHRLLLSPAAEIEGKQVEALVAELVSQTEAPR